MVKAESKRLEKYNALAQNVNAILTSDYVTSLGPREE
jgi:hypothetical protein